MKIRIFSSSAENAKTITRELIYHALSFNVEFDGLEYIIIVEADDDRLSAFVEENFRDIYGYNRSPNESMSDILGDLEIE